MKKYVEQLLKGNDSSQSLHLALLIASLVLIALVLFIFWRKRKSRGNIILLTGLSDSGKTLIYARLLYSQFVKTYTSVKENIGDITINYRSLRIVDIPGDERLRGKYFDKYKSSVKGLVYIIDAVTIQKEIRDVAEYLYNLLSDPDIQKNVPVLIMCNKQDQTMAKGCYVIKALLEKEMNLLRMTKTSQLEATDASSTNVFLGKQGKHFEFSHLDSQIDFVESYASNDDSRMSADFEELKKWLIKIA
ncbi:Signal recognition particle receptor subunit beta [Trachymyrmex zeteki]|uniref:Signal recognition particle receptor subunit beta n=1 Tax=Mycetomoellerius zeteki TaxID=64791 RepID=A0A151WWI8_9HYME|nr:PREDICTED: signal recognition particle receptor subunit beta [Trachymyrmex zeteki]KYQ52253.1 Signal recognition particle receptor subunit beta [Trachymyrmex zeteki]